MAPDLETMEPDLETMAPDLETMEPDLEKMANEPGPTNRSSKKDFQNHRQKSRYWPSSYIEFSQIKWFNVTALGALHIASIYGFVLLLTECKLQTLLAWYCFGAISGMGITAGAHRLWSHRAYKARLPLRILLMLLNSMALQNDIYAWCRDHRAHHKYSETDADPHNSKRGFFFAHIGWLMCRKHPDVARKGQSLNFDDLLLDPVVRFQRRYYVPLVLLLCFAIPTAIPVYLWNESVRNSFFTCSLLRYCYTLHCTWCVNSVAHMFGTRQYDCTIGPCESDLVVYGTYGEGYHNYHHVFPYDYSASELDWRYNLNFSTMFIDAFAAIGWAYDLRRAPAGVIARRVHRTGDERLQRQISSLFRHGLGRQHWWRRATQQIVLATGHLWLPAVIRGVCTLSHI